MDYNTLFNNGIAIACLSYFMYVTNTTLKSVSASINNNTQVIRELKEDIKMKELSK